MLLFGTTIPDGAKHVWDLSNNPVQAAKRLYAALREMDQSRLQNLYVVLPNQDQPKPTDWLAITDRLHRATQSK